MPYCYKHVSEDNPRGVYYDVLCPECAKAPKYVERDERHEGARKAGRKLRSNQWTSLLFSEAPVRVAKFKNDQAESDDPFEKYALPGNVYGGVINFEPSIYDIGAKPKSLGRVDENGNQVKCNPKDGNMNKNAAAKQRVKYLVRYEEGDAAIIGEPSEHDEVYFSEYGLSQIKEAYQYVNEDMDVVINSRWKAYTRLTKNELDTIKANREDK